MKTIDGYSIEYDQQAINDLAQICMTVSNEYRTYFLYSKTESDKKVKSFMGDIKKAIENIRVGHGVKIKSENGLEQYFISCHLYRIMYYYNFDPEKKIVYIFNIKPCRPNL